jgi:hypothetical protein
VPEMLARAIFWARSRRGLPGSRAHNDFEHFDLGPEKNQIGPPEPWYLPVQGTGRSVGQRPEDLSRPAHSSQNHLAHFYFPSIEGRNHLNRAGMGAGSRDPCIQAVSGRIVT